MFKRESLGITEIYSAAECLRVQNDQLDDNKTIVAGTKLSLHAIMNPTIKELRKKI